MDSRARSVLRKELQRAEEERNRLDAVIEYLRDRLRENDEDSARAPAVAPGRDGQAGNGIRRVTAAEAAEDVLRETGHRMRTSELLSEARNRGAQMKDAEGMYKTLARSPKFRREGRGLWALSEWAPAQRSLDDDG